MMPALQVFYGTLDVIPPTPTVGLPTRTKISRVTGRDSTSFDWSSNEDFQAYQVRLVPLATSLVGAGTLLVSGGSGSTGQVITTTITDDEMVAAGAAEGTSIVKVFVQDNAGNWST